MAANSVPNVFVSSTCYDLAQLRANLEKFIVSLGLCPVLSDYRPFPVNPDLGAVDNCLRVLEERADICVLIVGGRYGSETDQGKSVTNLEYLRAKAKGIPVYTFVQRRIRELLPLWEKNPGADYRSIVDSPKVFEFVAGLMEPPGAWVFPFDNAQDIEDTLRSQFAYLFGDALHIRMRFKEAHLPDALSHLKGEALRLVIERPFAWEFLLFNEVLSREIEKYASLKMDLQYGAVLGQMRALAFSEVSQWLTAKRIEGQRIIAVMEQILNTAANDAMGPPGVPGDPIRIVYAAEKLGEAYRSTLDWQHDFQRVQVPDVFTKLFSLVARLTSNVPGDIERYTMSFRSQLDDAIKNPPPPGEQRTITARLHLTIPEGLSEDISRETARLTEELGLNSQ